MKLVGVKKLFLLFDHVYKENMPVKAEFYLSNYLLASLISVIPMQLAVHLEILYKFSI